MRLRSIEEVKHHLALPTDEDVFHLAEDELVNILLPVPAGCTVFAINCSTEYANSQKVKQFASYRDMDECFQELSMMTHLLIDFRTAKTLREGKKVGRFFYSGYQVIGDDLADVESFSVASFREELKTEFAQLYIFGGIQRQMTLRYYHAPHSLHEMKHPPDTEYIAFVLVDYEMLKRGETIEKSILNPTFRMAEVRVDIARDIEEEKIEGPLEQNRQRYLSDEYATAGLKVLIDEWFYYSVAADKDIEKYISGRINHVRAALKSAGKKGGVKCADYLLRFALPLDAKKFPKFKNKEKLLKELEVAGEPANSVFIEICLQYLRKLANDSSGSDDDAKDLRYKFESKGYLTGLVVKYFGLERTVAENLSTIIFEFERDNDGAKQIKRQSQGSSDFKRL
ncbi:hypothetical protein [Alteromonas gracilis]|uniref:hypothetical protein n=1 Tax=Alteromonas gracilis TaxID=1479524 RepID=UPI0030CF872C